MKKNDKEIMAKYPSFIHPEKPITQCLMAFGFETGEGWYPILEKLFEKMSKIELPPGFEVQQVKEKYGELCVYVNSYTDEIDSLIDEAEAEAQITCENCGEQGQLSNRGNWLKTLCPKCREEGGYSIEN